ncbi:PIR protein, putative [Plasmodium sp.]|nr:PIR protein, putative [Plasmodium sp.]
MKIHCINILLFAVALNILVNTHKKTSITQKRLTTRLLCECELYSPAIYDNDPQMKSVIDNFNKQTQQRLNEYDQRMKTTRQECKEQCDKEIQKIILKDKLEKELMDKFATLHTDMQSDAIPTCVCENSIADKVEKECLKCAQNLGGIAVPSSGVLGEIAAFAVNGWKTTAIAAATKYAMKEGAAQGAIAGNARGMEIVIEGLKALKVDTLKSGIFNTFVTTNRYTEVINLASAIDAQMDASCGLSTIGTPPICVVRGKLGVISNPGQAKVEQIDAIKNVLNQALGKATQSAEALSEITANEVAAELTAQKTDAINTIFMSKQTAIIASIVAIVVIVLIMVIIYLILRYRRKKKMKKKLQYIKLLEE